MARKGMYKDAPALPAVIGYDVVGFVDRDQNQRTGKIIRLG